MKYEPSISNVGPELISQFSPQSLELLVLARFVISQKTFASMSFVYVCVNTNLRGVPAFKFRRGILSDD